VKKMMMMKQSRLVGRKKLGSVAASVNIEKPAPPIPPSPPPLILRANVQEEEEEEDSSGDETETDVDLPVKVGGIRAEVKPPPCDDDSASSSSEETETDEDLPAAVAHKGGACHRVKQEIHDEHFENGFYARGDCTYDCSIKSLNVRLQGRPSDVQTGGGQKKQRRRAPSLSQRLFLLQQQQQSSSSQKRKAVQVNQVVKSLWPVSPESQIQHNEGGERNPVTTSYSVSHFTPKKLQTVSSRKANKRTTEEEDDDADDDECKGEYGFSISRKRKCGIRVVQSTSRNHLLTEQEEQEQSHCNGQELHNGRRDCSKLSSSSSEGTESDREHEGVVGSPLARPELSVGCTGLDHLQKPGRFAPAAMENHSLHQGVGGSRKVSMNNRTCEKKIGQLEAASMTCRMTPRTRKLTDAMQKFLTQKVRSRQWKEIDLGAVHPTALIGRSCKIFWPLDDEWYPGVIHDYHSQTHKHRIDYKDNEREWLILAKERVKLKVTPEELVEIKSSIEEHPSRQIMKKPDLDGFAALAAGVDDHEGQLGHGDLVWAKVKGYPMWPALIMDEEHAKLCEIEPATRAAMLPLQFFGSYDYARISSKKVVSFSRGLMLKLHAKRKRLAFEQGLAEVETYLKEHRLPEAMLRLLDSQGDGALGVIERQKPEFQESWPEPDSLELMGKKRNHQAVGKIVGGCLSSFPLNLGTLSVLSLGKIVKDSEHFHDQHYIWTEGYTAIRRYNSIRDPATIVGYRMEVVRNPCMLSLPMFRVTPDDELPIEGPSPSACWKKLYLKLQKVKEKSGKKFGPEHEKRHPWRSGAAMFGFSNPRVAKLIQGLPNARACTNFTNWLDKSPVQATTTAVLPVGYKPVNVSWKHLDRCTVCYLDEEYVGNLLLQCDKCRIMVHMNCYGELEPPDGDLWLCNLCRSDAPKVRPPCCLCPVTGGAMKKTTEGRWAHLMCAMWIPETCLVDVKRMEPVDGINAINKARWKLTCSVCKVPYGACIQCVVSNCKVAFHPLCARSAGFCMEVLEEKMRGNGETDLQLLAYCRRHKQPTSNTCEVISSPHQSRPDCMAYTPPANTSGCARTEPYNAAARRGRREPEALAAALAKRLFVENLPYVVSGCQHGPPKRPTSPRGGSLWSWHWETQKAGPPLTPTVDLPISISSPADSEDVGEVVLSMSEKFRHMRSSVNQRLTFGKSAIHGWGVFTKQAHLANDMVIEYAGEVVRPVIADIRERRCYDSLVGAGTYMFRIDDERVIDATHTGSIGHLINHSCEPNCFSRVVTASGEDRIIIFAKRDIPPGEELTYDYRFMSKDEQLTCYCGCSGCRGSVNVNDSDSEPCNLVLHHSELIKLTSTSRGHSH
jgi:hypothetical protein